MHVQWCTPGKGASLPGGCPGGAGTGSGVWGIGGDIVRRSTSAVLGRYRHGPCLFALILLALVFSGCAEKRLGDTVAAPEAASPPPAAVAATPAPPVEAAPPPEPATRQEPEALREAEKTASVLIEEAKERAPRPPEAVPEKMAEAAPAPAAGSAREEQAPRRQAEEARASRVPELAREMATERSVPPPQPRAAAPRAAAPSPARAARPAAAPLPEFPWPPPEPSTRTELPNALFAVQGKATPSLAAVGAQLVGALERTRYFEYSYYRAPGGFALVARLERMASDGAPLPEELRFLQPGSQEPFSLAVYVTRLFFAPEGLYRQIVFVVSDQPFTATGAKIDATTATRLLRGGANRLSGDYETTPFTPDHRVSALVYEFQKGARDGDVSALMPGRLGARTHLDRTGIYPALERGGR